jgi:hypothetical protein
VGNPILDPTQVVQLAASPAVNLSVESRRAGPLAERGGALMHADDTNYTVIKNGVVVVSGTGPALRIDGNKLVIRDGPKETRPLALTRAEASRKLRHVIMTGTAGGYATFDAFRRSRCARRCRSLG